MFRYRENQNVTSTTLKTCVQNSDIFVGDFVVQSSSSTNISSSPKFKSIVPLDDRTYIIKKNSCKSISLNSLPKMSSTMQYQSNSIEGVKNSFLKRQKARTSLKKDSLTQIRKKWINDKNILSSTRVDFTSKTTKTTHTKVTRRCTEVLSHKLVDNYIHNGKRIIVDSSKEAILSKSKKRRISLIAEQAESTTCKYSKRKKALPSLNISKVTTHKQVKVNSTLNANDAFGNPIVNDGQSRFNNYGDLLVWFV
jgi:sRNA-binding protein